MEDFQGKTPKQVEDSTKFVFYSLIGIVVLILGMIIVN